MSPEPALTLTFSGAYGLDRLDRTIATLEPVLVLDEPTIVTLDLYRLVHLSPTAIALMTAAVRRVIDAGLTLDGSQIIQPKSKSVRQYVQRMNVMRELAADGESLERFRRKPASGFRPCEHFSNDRDYSQVAASLTDALCETRDVGTAERGAIRVALDEVCENVIHHADSPLGGFAAAQGWPDSRRRRFEIGIVDLGVGVRTSLAKNPDYADIDDDVEAIRTALKPRVTSTPERNAGIGLFVTSLLLSLNKGDLIVRSGAGEVRRGARPSERSRSTSLPGTVVALRANMDQPLDLGPVYEALDRAAAQAQIDDDDVDHREDDT